MEATVYGVFWVRTSDLVFETWIWEFVAEGLKFRAEGLGAWDLDSFRAQEFGDLAF